MTDKDPPQKGWIVDVLIKVASGTATSKDRSVSRFQPASPGDPGQVVIIAALLSTIQAFSTIRVKLPHDLRNQGDKNAAYRAISEIMRRFPEGPTALDPVYNMGIKDKRFEALVQVSLDEHAETNGS